MNRLLLFCMFVCIWPMNGMTSENVSYRLTLEYLMGHKWYPDVYGKNSPRSSVITFTSTQQETVESIKGGNQKKHILSYYLSDTPDLTFDVDKVGKIQSGKYLILKRKTETGESLTFILEVVFMSEEKMSITNWTEEFTSYGHTTTYYTSPIQ